MAKRKFPKKTHVVVQSKYLKAKKVGSKYHQANSIQINFKILDDQQKQK